MSRLLICCRRVFVDNIFTAKNSVCKGLNVSFLIFLSVLYFSYKIYTKNNTTSVISTLLEKMHFVPCLYIFSKKVKHKLLFFYINYITK